MPLRKDSRGADKQMGLPRWRDSGELTARSRGRAAALLARPGVETGPAALVAAPDGRGWF